MSALVRGALIKKSQSCQLVKWASRIQFTLHILCKQAERSHCQVIFTIVRKVMYLKARDVPSTFKTVDISGVLH